MVISSIEARKETTAVRKCRNARPKSFPMRTPSHAAGHAGPLTPALFRGRRNAIDPPAL